MQDSTEGSQHMKTFLLVLVGLGASSLYGATIVYSNTTTDTGSSIQFAANGYTSIGDQISLTGTDRLALTATTQFFNSLSTSGTFSATLRLYAVGVNPSVVGALLGSYTVNNIAITGFDLNNPLTTGTTNVTFSNLNVTVPNSLIFVLSVANVTNADLGLTLFDTPTAGTSDNASFITAVGNTFSVTPGDPGFSNVNFSLTATATPEPVTLTMIGSGLLVLTLARRKRNAA